jgi:hypothetical protein
MTASSRERDLDPAPFAEGRLGDFELHPALDLGEVFRRQRMRVA